VKDGRSDRLFDITSVSAWHVLVNLRPLQLVETGQFWRWRFGAMAALSDDHLLVLVDQALYKHDGLIAFVLDALLLCIVDPVDLSQLAVFSAGGLGRDNHAIDVLHVAMAVDDCLMVNVANE